MADGDNETKISFETLPGRLTLTVSEGDKKLSLNLPVAGAARLARAILHHASEAAALESPDARRVGEQGVFANAVSVPALGVSPMGDPVLVCRDGEGLTFHLAIDRASAQSLVAQLSETLQDDTSPHTRQ